MNHRTRGIVIALASGAAGGLLPAAVSAGMLGTHFMAAGLFAVVLLNFAIAIIHIKEPFDSNRMRDDEWKADAKRSGTQAIRAVNSNEAAKRESAAS